MARLPMINTTMSADYPEVRTGLSQAFPGASQFTRHSSGDWTVTSSHRLQCFRSSTLALHSKIVEGDFVWVMHAPDRDAKRPRDDQIFVNQWQFVDLSRKAWRCAVELLGPLVTEGGGREGSRQRRLLDYLALPEHFAEKLIAADSDLGLDDNLKFLRYCFKPTIARFAPFGVVRTRPGGYTGPTKSDAADAGANLTTVANAGKAEIVNYFGAAAQPGSYLFVILRREPPRPGSRVSGAFQTRWFASPTRDVPLQEIYYDGTSGAVEVADVYYIGQCVDLAGPVTPPARIDHVQGHRGTVEDIYDSTCRAGKVVCILCAPVQCY